MNDNSSKEWSDFELNILKKSKDKTAKEIQKIIKNRSLGAITAKKAKVVGAQNDFSEWTREEDEILKQFGDTLSVKELTKKIPNKSFHRISDRRLKLLGNISQYAGNWSKEEIEILNKSKNDKFSKIKALFPNKNSLHIRRKIEALFGNRTDKYHWTQDEIKILINNSNLSNEDLLKILPNKTLKQIKKANLEYKTSDYNFWAKEEIENLKNLSKEFELRIILRKIKNRTPSSIKTQYYKLNLKAPTRNNWPENYKKFYKKENNNGKNLLDYEFKYSKYEIIWQCVDNDKHKFPRSVATVFASYKNGSKFECPFCAGKLVNYENSLKGKFPNIASYFDVKKNKIGPDKVLYTITKRYWWICSKNHSFLKGVFPTTHDYVGGDGEGNSKQLYKIKKEDIFVCDDCNSTPFIVDDKRFAKFIHPTLNKGIDISRIRVTQTKKKIYWQCSKNEKHSWLQSPYNIYRNFKADANYDVSTSCHHCLNILVGDENNLQFKRPDIAEIIDKKLNLKIDLTKIYYQSTDVFFFQCKKYNHHRWSSSLRAMDKTKGELCHHCRKDYRKPENIKILLESIKDDLPFLTEQQKWVFFQQSGLLDYRGQLFSLSKAIISNRFPLEEINKYISNQPSLVDDFLQDKNLTNDDIENQSLAGANQSYLEDFHDLDDENEEQITNTNFDSVKDNPLPEIKSKDFLKALDNTIKKIHSDEEAIEYLLVSGKHKLWDDVFLRGLVALEEIKSFKGGKYIQKVKNEFLDEYDTALNLKIPKGYNFRINGKFHPPNLMQKLVASRSIIEKRIGNFSGTGAGKTLSAILASRIIDSKITIITCPNSVVENWSKNIISIFPDSIVCEKEINKKIINLNLNNYLIFNYEYFQQINSDEKTKALLSLGQIDMIVIDEIHYTKQRVAENVSKRKEMIKNLIVEAGKKNKELTVIGMSATPVINNLFEGRTMIEMITGKEHSDLDTKANIPNCMKIYQSLSTLGTRWMPKYNIQFTQKEIEIDSTSYVEEIREKVKKRDILKLEQILTKARLPIIIENLEPKTIIYTHYIDGIGDYLKKAIEEKGYSVGMYTGFDKTGLKKFIEEDTDVLIGTSALGTGIDGLQNVCKKLIVNILPWTNAEFEQLKGRIYRQGQLNPVEIIVPVTTMEINGEIKSWCKDKLARIKYKKSLADAAVDGVIPEEHFRDEHQVLDDLMKWIERISSKNIHSVDRKLLLSSLFTEDSTVLKKRFRKYGDFSRLNRNWNVASSSILHKRLSKDNEEWVHYHQLYREAREKWPVTPYLEIIKRYKNRNSLVIGDFGCGEAFIHKELNHIHKVYSFDHVAINKFVTACDIQKTPLENEILDVVIFCLSLMGKELKNYIIEANRTLKLDGRIHIIESASRFKNLDEFKKQLKKFGFEFIVVEEMWKFIHITAQKSDRPIKSDALIAF
jgi:superfamily II DNA or RNA helicase